MLNAPFKRAGLSVLDSKLSIASLTWELNAFYSLKFSDIKEKTNHFPALTTELESPFRKAIYYLTANIFEIGSRPTP